MTDKNMQARCDAEKFYKTDSCGLPMMVKCRRRKGHRGDHRGKFEYLEGTDTIYWGKRESAGAELPRK